MNPQVCSGSSLYHVRAGLRSVRIDLHKKKLHLCISVTFFVNSCINVLIFCMIEKYKYYVFLIC